MPFRICTKAGCRLLVEIGGSCPGNCPRKDRKAHRKGIPARVGAQPSAHQRGYGRDWQRFRAARLASEPLCYCCLHGTPSIVTVAMELHHIIPRSLNGPRLEQWNTLPLCCSCHAAITSSPQYEPAVRAAVRAHPPEQAAAALLAQCVAIVQARRQQRQRTPT